MVRIWIINLDTKIQGRILKQHSTILGAVGKEVRRYLFVVFGPMEVEHRIEKNFKESFLCSLRRNSKFCGEREARW
jgi:hypothetical protein